MGILIIFKIIIKKEGIKKLTITYFKIFKKMIDPCRNEYFFNLFQ